MNPWILGGIAIAGGIAVAVAYYASGPGCPTEAQKRKAFADVASGTMNAAAADVTAKAWESCGLKAEAEALRYAAKLPGSLDKPADVTPPLPAPASTTPIPGTNIAIPKSFPASLTGGPKYECSFEAGSRDFAVMVVMGASDMPENQTAAYADIMQRFAEQLAFCGDMANAEKVGKRSEAIRPKVASTTGFGARRDTRDACAPPWVQAARRRAG